MYLTAFTRLTGSTIVKYQYKLFIDDFSTATAITDVNYTLMVYFNTPRN